MSGADLVQRVQRVNRNRADSHELGILDVRNGADAFSAVAVFQVFQSRTSIDFASGRDAGFGAWFTPASIDVALLSATASVIERVRIAT